MYVSNLNDMKENTDHISIIIPTYNESENIVKLLESICKNIAQDIPTEVIVVDDNSPDGTAKIVEDYKKKTETISKFSIEVISRKIKQGLSSAILDGIKHSRGNTIIIMDADLSHPPNIIPRMLETFKDNNCDIVIGSRYILGGRIIGWSFKRKFVSKVATKIAQRGLGVESSDPMSGFFAFRRDILEGIKFDAIGFKMLLEILVKKKGARIKEIPYTFSNRQQGFSKLTVSVIIDYLHAVWKLYRYGKSVRRQEERTSVRFLSKAGRFYTVGASGFFVNYLVSFLFTLYFPNVWYVYANLVGIISSITSNFFLNKRWTFEDKDFSPKRTVEQYGKFATVSSLGAAMQLSLVYVLVNDHGLIYPLSLFLAVLVAAFGNFVLNKIWTFKEKLWS